MAELRQRLRKGRGNAKVKNKQVGGQAVSSDQDREDEKAQSRPYAYLREEDDKAQATAAQSGLFVAFGRKAFKEDAALWLESRQPSQPENARNEF